MKKMVCPRCKTPMIGVKSFSQDEKIKFFRCPKCWEETKPQKMTDFDLNFDKNGAKMSH